jgi:hypothetical protein
MVKPWCQGFFLVFLVHGISKLVYACLGLWRRYLTFYHALLGLPDNGRDEIENSRIWQNVFGLFILSNLLGDSAKR